MPDSAADRDARQITGAMLRGTARFATYATLRAHPDLKGTRKAAALARELDRHHSYAQNARSRVRDQLRAAYRATSDPDTRREAAQKIAAQEQRHLTAHLNAAANRVRVDADLMRLRAAGHERAIPVLSERAEHCEFCIAMAGKSWPIGVLLALYPPHVGCQCRFRGESEARAAGLSFVRGVDPPSILATAGRPIVRQTNADRTLNSAIRKAARLVPQLVMRAAGAGASAAGTAAKSGAVGGAAGVAGTAAIAKVSADSAASSAELERRLREALMPRFDERDHDRWPAGSPQGGRFRRKDLVGPVPQVMRRSLERLTAAAQVRDHLGVETAYRDMLADAKKLDDPAEQAEALRAAGRARAAAINPRGERVPTGRTAPGAAQPVATSAPQAGRSGPWSERGEFLWQLSAGELGPGHGEAIAALRRRRAFIVTDLDGGGVTIATAPGRSGAQAQGDARRLEVLVPQLRVMRARAVGDDLVDTRPLDIAADETVRDPDRRAQTHYPGVTMRQLGASAENLADAVAARLTELGIAEPDATVSLPSLERPDSKSPLDWQIGDLAVSVRAQSMRALTPGAQPPVSAGTDVQRAQKIAAAAGKRPALAFVATDLDRDVAHVFFHEYAPGEEFTGRRLPARAVERLLDGTIRPGDWETAGSAGEKSGDAARRFTFVGTFRLGYNPLIADPSRPLDPKELDRLRARARPYDVGVPATGPEPVADRVTVTQTQAQSRVERQAERRREEAQRAERDAQIRQLAAQKLTQTEIAARLGVSQATVSNVLRKSSTQRFAEGSESPADTGSLNGAGC